MPLEAVLFTKLFGTRSMDEIGDAASALGFDGIDLLVRPGFSVTPEDARAIPLAVRTLRTFGLTVPTATTDMTDPAGFPVDSVLGSCADAGIGLVRLGYWMYARTTPYETQLDAARRHLDVLERKAGQHGIVLTLQLHGGTIHASGALARQLLHGRDGSHIGAYADPGNQMVQDGHESWPLTFDLLSAWLKCVGVKNGGRAPAATHSSGQRLWTSDWLGVPDGAVPWHEIVPYLVRTGFSGPLSFHGHYDLPFEQVLDQTHTDLRFVRRLLEAA